MQAGVQPGVESGAGARAGLGGDVAPPGALHSDTGHSDTGHSDAGQPGSAPSLTVEEAGETVVETLRSILEQFVAHLPLLAAGLLILVVTALVGAVGRRASERAMRDVEVRGSLKQLIARFVVIAVWALGLLLAAMVTFPGLTPARALTALGVGSIAIGLAFKDIFENFFAGVLILWRFPFENGDFISCNGITGRVVDVTVRNTVLRTVTGELVVIPNADLYKNPVDVLTDRPRRRQAVMCGVAYGEEVGEAREVIRGALKACETVSQESPIEVFAHGFGSSSVDFEVAWWSGATPVEQRRSRDEVVDAIKTSLDAAGIEIPFPYRTLTFKQPLVLDDGRGAGGGGDGGGSSSDGASARGGAS